jgi:tetratricopeptide (TPR) repeat protein
LLAFAGAMALPAPEPRIDPAHSSPPVDAPVPLAMFREERAMYPQVIRWSGRLFVSALVLMAFCCASATPQDTLTLTEKADEISQPAGVAPPTLLEIRPTETQPPANASPDADKPLQPVADPANAGPAEIDAASFKGVTPGVTTMAEVEKTWGAPREMTKQANAMMGLYAVEPFDQVEVSFYAGKVTSIVIRFERAFPADKVAEQLELSNVQPVLVSNELGEILGQVYPERGVLFAFETGEQSSRNVSQIILEPISAEPFVLRAETNLEIDRESSLADLSRALEIQPTNARAHWLYGRLLAATEDFQKAVAACGQAVRLEPGNPQYRVTWAEILGQTGRLGDALQQAQQAADASQSRPHVKARALCLQGDLLASGTEPDYKSAIQYHMQALQLAEPLAANRHPAIRRAAKEVLLDAHLGAAHDIAWGVWKHKQEAVTKWLERADLLAKDLIENEGRGGELRFHVCTRALAAYVGMQGQLDPEQWTQQALLAGEQLITATKDPDRQAQYQWELGMALYDALQVYQMRDDHQRALKYGEAAVKYLEDGDRQKQTPTTNYLLGRLYFRLGAVHAIRDQDHAAAVAWFDKAVPLLDKPLPKEAARDLGRHGESFVSMGVSYWESGNQDKAVELTQRGVELIEQAVKQGLTGAAALAVPYDNLAAMNRQLGRDQEADQFQEMAAKIKGTTTR